MALTLFEDTFATLAQANTRLSGKSHWAESNTAEKEQALRDATSALNEMLWASSASVTTQPLAWPREDFKYFDPVYNAWISVEEGTIPARLTRATCNLAGHYRQYPSATDNFSASFDRIKLGPLEVEDSNTEAKPPKIPYREVTKLIAPLMLNPSDGTQWWRAN